MDSIASMARIREGHLTSARIDQWSLLRHDDTKEEKDKKGRGKGEDKGKLSPRHVAQPGAASSTSFMGVPTPLSPHSGGATPGLVPVVGGASGHIKMEPPTKFIGKGFPTIWE